MNENAGTVQWNKKLKEVIEESTRTYSKNIWMTQPQKQSNLRSKLLLKKRSQIFIFFRLTHKLNCNILLLVNTSIDSTVPTRSKFRSNKQLRHICTPFFFTFSFDCSTRRYQILWPRHCSFVLTKWKSPPRLSTVRNLFIPVQILHVGHGYFLPKSLKIQPL